MKPIFGIWGKKWAGQRPVAELSTSDWLDICDAAKFHSVCGNRMDEIVSCETGTLYVIDSCGEAHAVDPLLFVAVPPNETP